MIPTAIHTASRRTTGGKSPRPGPDLRGEMGLGNMDRRPFLSRQAQAGWQAAVKGAATDTVICSGALHTRLRKCLPSRTQRGHAALGPSTLTNRTGPA